MQKDLSKAPNFVNQGIAWPCGILLFSAIPQMFALTLVQ